MSLLDGVPPYQFTRTQHQAGTPLTDHAINRDIIAPINALQTGVEHLSNNIAVGQAISVKNYGAKGDGLADDTTKVHLARDAAATGGAIFFPQGTYLTGAGLSANVAKQTWYLAPGATIKLANGTNQVPLIITADDVTITSTGQGTFDANKANQSSGSPSGIISTGQRTRLEGLVVTNSRGPGIQLISCTDFLLDDLYLPNCGGTSIGDGTRSAIMIGGSSYGTVRRPIIDSPSECGIFVYNANQNRRIQIDHPIIRNCGDIGIALDGGGTANRAGEILITQPLITGCLGNGIDTGQAQYWTVLGGVIDGCSTGIAQDTGGTALYIEGEIMAHVIGVTCKNSTNTRLDGGQGFVVQGGTYLENCLADRNAASGFMLAAGRATADTTEQHTTFNNCTAKSNGINVIANSQAGFQLNTNGPSLPIYRVTFNGCHAFDDGAATQLYGLQLYSSGANGIIDHLIACACNFEDNITAAYNKTNITLPTVTAVAAMLPSGFAF